MLQNIQDDDYQEVTVKLFCWHIAQLRDSDVLECVILDTDRKLQQNCPTLPSGETVLPKRMTLLKTDYLSI